jgi:DNA polymerase-3 subunit epsilon
MREICLDVETTGLDPKQGHKIIEIAAVEMINKVKTNNFFHSYINPRREVPFEAFKIHGISTEFLTDKPLFDHIADKFLKFIGSDFLIIHNAAFDTKFINYELSLLGLKSLNKDKIIDSLLIARSKFPGSPASLDALCKRFSIDLSKRQKHGALLDSELLCDVYVELMGGAQAGIDFDAISQPRGEIDKSFYNAKNDRDQENLASNIAELNNPLNEQDQLKQEVNKEKISSNNKKIIPSRNFQISQEELKLHQEFIVKNFKSNLWGY